VQVNAQVVRDCAPGCGPLHDGSLDGEPLKCHTAAPLSDDEQINGYFEPTKRCTHHTTVMTLLAGKSCVRYFATLAVGWIVTAPGCYDPELNEDSGRGA